MNQILLAIILAFLGSQGVKMILHSYKNKKFSHLYIFETGGMPSGHSALTMALTTSILIIEGTSTAFFISALLAFITIRDATGVRYTAGVEGQYLTKLLKKHKIKGNPKFAQGHTPMQAFVGTVVGILSALIATGFLFQI
ncbi:divergent PAP2 family protein [archaeon]|jgi:uncharacterized protein|nr:divergent PAP2 family protein [archaeon]MBT6762263.1 divergent PAP2 family protein [archaeon]